MAVIIKDFQVITNQPDTQGIASTPTRQEQAREPMPPPPKKIAQTLRHIKRRLARVHAD